NALPRKPLYLKRNVTQVQKALRIQKKNSQHSVASVSSATLGAVAVTSTSTTQATASATVTTMATVNAASGDAKTLTTSSAESTTASLTTTAAASSRDGSTEPVPMDIDESVPGASPGGFWAKRPPERMPAPPTLADEYFTDSKAEMKLNFNSYKMVLVMNKDDVFYKRNALRRAKLTHKLVTKRMKTRFQKFIDSWLDENVAEGQKSECSDWLMGLSDDLAPNSTVLKQDNDVKKAPYSTINRYTVTRTTDS
uniref:Uncharacterized protein n=2 Tax=Phlebotomus papatasi TaxID=29031 RepID=A0A1B0D3P7_PHLPP